MGVDDGAGADETGRGSGNLGGETFGGGAACPMMRSADSSS
jgi:hypothetical protein